MRLFSRLASLLVLSSLPVACGGASTTIHDDASVVAANAAVDGGSGVDAGTEGDGRAAAVDSGTEAEGGKPSTTDPSAAGPYAVLKSSVAITGSTAVSFVPSMPSDIRAPLVILKHGFQLATSNYAVVAERVASHGFIVVGVDTGGGPFGGPTNVDERGAVVSAIDWALTGAPFAGRVDADHIAVMGHSRGGKVAVMAAASDRRVDAVLLLDPVNGCGPGASFSASCPDVTTSSFAGALRMPVGVMGETNNGTGGLTPCAPLAENYQKIYAGISGSSWAVQWTFTGADHMDFTDDGGGLSGSFCADGPGDDTAIRANVRTLAVAFMRLHLRSESAMAAWLTGASLPSGITHTGP